jgi:hypothetical protein
MIDTRYGDPSHCFARRVKAVGLEKAREQHAAYINSLVPDAVVEEVEEVEDMEPDVVIDDTESEEDEVFLLFCMSVFYR